MNDKDTSNFWNIIFGAAIIAGLVAIEHPFAIGLLRAMLGGVSWLFG